MSRRLLTLLASALALLALWPLLQLLSQGLQGLQQGLVLLGPEGGRQIRGTLLLLLGSALGGTVIGTANGWLLINCRFPGRRWLRIAQLVKIGEGPDQRDPKAEGWWDQPQQLGGQGPGSV